MGEARFLPIRQLIYHSIAVNSGLALAQDLKDILAVSRVNNGIEAITGLLLAGRGRYIQVLEGNSESVGLVFGWIRADRRHSRLIVVEDALVERRSFGSWTMANLEDGDRDQLDRRLTQFLNGAGDHVRKAFTLVL